MLVDYHAAALRELNEITSYYEWQLPNLGLDFLDALERALSLVAENPHLGAVYHRSFRRISLQRFPFAVFYLVERDVIRVMAVAHQRRMPDYWSKRR